MNVLDFKPTVLAKRLGFAARMPQMSRKLAHLTVLECQDGRCGMHAFWAGFVFGLSCEEGYALAENGRLHSMLLAL